jgi:capsular exopolysaccharide synthesis family protein
MKFLEALQKTDSQAKPSTVVVKSSERKARTVARLDAKMPDLLTDETAVIGKPSSDQVHIDGGTPLQKSTNGTASRSPLDGTRSLTIVPEAVNPCLVALTEPKSSFTEEYRNLRTHLLQKSKKQRLQSLAVTRVAPGEGKSVTALNLAWLLAQTEAINALIIDCDLRRPSLSKYVGANFDRGLSDVLDGEIDLKEAVVRLDPSGLYLLPGGKLRYDASEVLSGPTFTRIIEDATAMFDFVIIDAPPLGALADAKIVINSTDAALIVIRSNYTNYKTLGRIMEDLPQDRLLGVVLNDCDEALIDSHYYDYY